MPQICRLGILHRRFKVFMTDHLKNSMQLLAQHIGIARFFQVFLFLL
jgi:hypothetical protein